MLGMVYERTAQRSGTRSTRRDLCYIAKESPRSARKVIAEIRASIEVLSDFPYLGRSTTDKPNVYRLVLAKQPYAAFYSVQRDGRVYIVRVLHAKRNK